MKKIEYGKQYGDDDWYMIWEIAGRGKKCLKLTGTLYSEGEIEDTENLFIPLENVRAENEKCVIAVKIDTDFNDYVNADKPGGFRNYQEVLEYEQEQAEKNLS